MGTIYPDGKKPSNKVVISKSGDGPAHKVDPDSGIVDRSFAQPNPSIEHAPVEPKAHASAQDEVEALNKNSKQGRDYKDGDGENSTD